MEDSMEDLFDDDLRKEFGTEWEQELLHKSEKVENDLYSEATDETGDDSPKRDNLEVLSKCFGHKKFRPMQWKIINSIINERRDNCAIMTTGYGKSLCYQYPSAYMGGITIVVSPLISLMEDQVLAMKVANIPACLLGTANANQRKTFEEIFEDKYSLVYLTPEFCTGETGKDLLKNMYDKLSISLVAIDEAHCVSSWGHDFRFQYRELGIFKKIMPTIPILAVTATATPKVREDIVKVLNLKNPQVLCTGFNRPNLYFSVYLKGKDPLVDFRKVMEREKGQWKFSGSTIIYCITRKSTEEISQVLSEAGIKSLPYHAGLSLKVRKETHENFVKDKVDVIVATIAFGMGIDKPDVRNIIHYGASNSIEGYYQEVGRAGRDGLPAKCTAFFSNNDFVIHRRLREMYGSDANKANKARMADIMLNYLSTRNCRRQFILSYFEGNKVVKPPKCTLCCDNCVRNNVQPDNEVFEDLDDQGKYDFTEDAKIFLEAVNALRGKCGTNMYVLFLRGSKSSKLSTYALKHRLHGSGKHKSEIWWKGVGALLEKEKYLEKKSESGGGFTYYTAHVSSKGKNFLENIGRQKLMVAPTPELIKCLTTKPNVWLGSEAVKQQQACLASGVTNNQQQQRPTTSTCVRPTETNAQDKDATIKLYKLLMNKRYQIATSLDCMPYAIASNKTLMDMAILKPTTLQELREYEIGGFTEAKVSKFGEDFLKILRSDRDVEDSDEVQKKLSMEELLIKYPITTLNASATVSYRHFKSGMTVDEIAKKRGVIPATVFSHLADCIKLGYPIKLIELGITDEIQQTIINAIKTVDTGLSLLTPIKNACPPDITFSQVKIVVNYLTVRQHLKKLNLEYEDFEDVHGDETISDVSSTRNSSQSNSPGKLTQLINAFDEMDKTSTDVDTNLKSESECIVKDEDSNFSEGFDDADLAAACDILETSCNEKDNGEPLPKKLKTEDSVGFSVLDSPPRVSDSTRQSSRDNQSVSSSSKNAVGQSSSQLSSSNPKNAKGQSSSQPESSSSKRNKEKLPPWLMMKRVA